MTRAEERRIARNLAFKALTPAQKRVKIAKDVIKQINKGFLVPRYGTWFNVEDFSFGGMFDNRAKNESFQLVLEKERAQKNSCECCALGGMFLTCTLLNNKTSVGEALDASRDLPEVIAAPKKMGNGLNRIFSRKQLSLIEAHFEKRSFIDSDFLPKGAAPFEIESHPYAGMVSKDRLIAIMENIIENNGTFKPHVYDKG